MGGLMAYLFFWLAGNLDVNKENYQGEENIKLLFFIIVIKSLNYTLRVHSCVRSCLQIKKSTDIYLRSACISRQVGITFLKRKSSFVTAFFEKNLNKILTVFTKL